MVPSARPEPDHGARSQPWGEAQCPGPGAAMPVALLPPETFSQAAAAFLRPWAGNCVLVCASVARFPVCGGGGAVPWTCAHQAMPRVSVSQQPTGFWAEEALLFHPRHSCYQLSLSMAAMRVSPSLRCPWQQENQIPSVSPFIPFLSLTRSLAARILLACSLCRLVRAGCGERSSETGLSEACSPDRASMRGTEPANEVNAWVLRSGAVGRTWGRPKWSLCFVLRCAARSRAAWVCYCGVPGWAALPELLRGAPSRICL